MAMNCAKRTRWIVVFGSRQGGVGQGTPGRGNEMVAMGKGRQEIAGNSGILSESETLVLE